MAGARTLPEHERCDRHRHYRLACGQFETLIARGGQKCEICRTPSHRTSWGRLHIDHDGPLWAVRGLLCGNCNIRLGTDTAFPGAPEYLANAWWIQQCAAIGVPTSHRPEPPAGSAVRDQFGTIWVRYSSEQLWSAPGLRRGPNSMIWDALYRSNGPHNLAPYDLRAAYKDQTLPDRVRHPIENGTSWGAVRVLLGVPDPQPRVKRAWHPRDSLPWLATPEKTANALRIFLAPEECRRVGELLLSEESDISDTPPPAQPGTPN